MSATGRATVRRERDAYMTPTWAAEAIMGQLSIMPHASVLEPCRGNGTIYKLFEWHFDEELIEWCEIAEGRDFLALPVVGHFDFVVTNPPYSLAQEFVEKSLEIANCVVMLLPLNFLASQKRREWWQSRKPSALFILSKRPSFTGGGTDSNEYAWFIWDSTGRQKTGIHWL